MKMRMSVCNTCKKVTHTSSVHKTTPCRLLTVSVCARMCAHFTTLYLINVTDCRSGVGNVSKYARLNEKSRRGIMGFHNTLLLLGMHVCVLGRRMWHITLSPTQIYTLTKDFIAADRQRTIESGAPHNRWTGQETFLACLDPLGDVNRTTGPPTLSCHPPSPRLDIAPGHNAGNTGCSMILHHPETWSHS